MADATAGPATGYMDRLTPFNAVVASFSAWLLVFVLSPVEPRWAEDPTGYMLALLGVAGLLLGAKLPEALHFAPREVAVSEKVCRRALKALMLLGLIGLGCKVFDSVALRGVDFTDNAVNAREQLGRGETNAFAVAAAALIPMGNAALLFGWYAKATGAVRRIGLTTWAVAAAPGVLSILLASRSALLIFGCLIFAAWLNLAPRIRAWHFAALAGAGAAATTLFAVVFVNRVELSGMTVLMAARQSAYTQVVPQIGRAHV